MGVNGAQNSYGTQNCRTTYAGCAGATYNICTSPYTAQFSVNNPGSAHLPPSALLPAAGINTFGPTSDIFCLGFQDPANTGISNVNFTNLSDVADIGVTTRARTLTQYLKAAWLASQLTTYTGSVAGNIQGAMWQVSLTGRRRRRAGQS